MLQQPNPLIVTVASASTISSHMVSVKRGGSSSIDFCLVGPSVQTTMENQQGYLAFRVVWKHLRVSINKLDIHGLAQRSGNASHVKNIGIGREDFCDT
jgi:hypothetical protein